MIDQITDLARDLAKAYIAYCRVIWKDELEPVDFDTWLTMRAAMANSVND